MTKTQLSLASIFLALGLQTGASAMQHAGAPGAAKSAEGKPAATVTSQADAKYRKAREACRRLDGTEQKNACLRKAKAAHAKSSKGASNVASTGDTRKPIGQPAPPTGTTAVQTQSAQVSATGVAPPAVDRRTPGVPATPTAPAAPAKK